MRIDRGIDDVPLLGGVERREFADPEIQESAAVKGRHDALVLIGYLHQRDGSHRRAGRWQCRGVRDRGNGGAQHRGCAGGKRVCRHSCRAHIERHDLGDIHRAESRGGRVAGRENDFPAVGGVGAPVLDDDTRIGKVEGAG